MPRVTPVVTPPPAWVRPGAGPALPVVLRPVPGVDPPAGPAVRRAAVSKPA